LGISIDNIAYFSRIFVHFGLFLSISDEIKFRAAGLHFVSEDRGFRSIRPKKDVLQQNRRLD
jgi:hypothetical protein